MNEQIKDAGLEEELLKATSKLAEERTIKKVTYTKTEEKVGGTTEGSIGLYRV